MLKLGHLSTQIALRPRIDEVHLDDDQAAESTHSATDAVVAVYQPRAEVLCKIHKSDLDTLGPDEMLNDTVVDFYMNYILHDIVPPER